MKPNPHMINENSYGFSKTCMHCSETTEFIITKDEYERWIIDNEYIQDVFSYLDKEERELMISGTHPKCWNEMFPIEEDECECEEMEHGQPCVYCIETKYE